MTRVSVAGSTLAQLVVDLLRGIPIILRDTKVVATSAASVALVVGMITTIQNPGNAEARCVELRATVEPIELFTTSKDRVPKRKVSKNDIGRICKLGTANGRYHVRLKSSNWWVSAWQLSETEINPQLPYPADRAPMRGGPTASQGIQYYGGPAASPPPASATTGTAR
jgi:hypothetical protein